MLNKKNRSGVEYARCKVVCELRRLKNNFLVEEYKLEANLINNVEAIDSSDMV